MQDARARAWAMDIPVVSVEFLERDPHEVFGRYRPLVPFIARPDGSLIILRANDVQRLILDERTRQAETEFPRMQGISSGPIFDFFQYGMYSANGAEHRRRRSPFSHAFASGLVTATRRRVRRIAEELLDEHQSAGEIDFINQFASQLPARTISRILGLPRSDIPHFTRLVYSASRFLGHTFTPDKLPEIERDAGELLDYVDRIILARRAVGEDDFLTSYLSAVDQQNELSPCETVIQIALMILIGSDPTRVALAAQLSLLLEHREQWDALCRDPALIPGAVTETMRFEPAVASVSRFALQDIEMEEFTLPAGRLLTLSTMSAMRDPAAFPFPDVFDIRRPQQPRWNVLFGAGPHRCLGESLARAEMEESLAALSSRLPHLRLVGEPPRPRGHFGIRRMDSLPVAWSLAAAA